MKWIAEDTTHSDVVAREFRVHSQGREVPGMLWTPATAAGKPVPLVLYGHGGSQHKKGPSVVDQALRLAQQYGIAMAAIDGPVHGDRRSDGQALGPQVQADFGKLWATDPQVDPMVADWRATLDALLALPELDAAQVGWCGLSMGTAYGLPLVAAESRIKAAVLGMWGGDFMNSERLMLDAPAVRCATFFQIKWNDQFFSRQGQLDLFDRIGTSDKSCKLYPGEHGPVMGPQQHDLEVFLHAQLR